MSEYNSQNLYESTTCLDQLTSSRPAQIQNTYHMACRPDFPSEGMDELIVLETKALTLLVSGRGVFSAVMLHGAASSATEIVRRC